LRVHTTNDNPEAVISRAVIKLSQIFKCRQTL